MALTVGTDTYISVTDCTDYLEEIYLSDSDELTAWGDLLSADKEVLLRQATKIIDSQMLQGAKAYYTQTLEFPRTMYTDVYNQTTKVYFMLNTGLGYTQTEVPDEVKYAQCEIAVTLAAIAGGSESKATAKKRAELQRQGVKSFSIGDLSETYNGKSDTIISERAEEYLKPYTQGGYAI